MKIIPLHPLEKGFFTIVDDDIYGLLIKFRWQVRKRHGGRYGCDAIYEKKRGGKYAGIVVMPRAIMNAPPHLQIDHINRNPLDNRRENLRLATQSQNSFNSKLYINNKSGLKGVYYQYETNPGAKTKRWRAFIQIDKKKTHIGYFQTPEEAARAYDDAAIEHYGEYALTNKSLGLL